MAALSAAAQQDNDSLEWSQGKKLAWEDFKGTNKLPFVGAQTFTSIKYKLQKSDTGCHVIVRCLFVKNLSWKDDSRATDYALAHEQVHFDISELYARKLRKAYAGYCHKRTTAREIRAIFKAVCAEKTAFNKRYDKETMHALDTAKQREWNTKVADMLQDLADYAAP